MGKIPQVNRTRNHADHLSIFLDWRRQDDRQLMRDNRQDRGRHIRCLCLHDRLVILAVSPVGRFAITAKALALQVQIRGRWKAIPLLYFLNKFRLGRIIRSPQNIIRRNLIQKIETCLYITLRALGKRFRLRLQIRFCIPYQRILQKIIADPCQCSKADHEYRDKYREELILDACKLHSVHPL